jgi:hypothetical protein
MSFVEHLQQKTKVVLLYILLITIVFVVTIDFHEPLISQGTTPSTSGLVGYWTLNEGTGITAHDSSSNNNDGTLKGSGIQWEWLATDYLIRFLGTGWIEVPDDPSLDLTSAVTVAAWIRPSSIFGYHRIAAKTHSADEYPWVLYGLTINQEGYVVFDVASATDRQWAQSTSILSTQEHTHIAGTYDGSYVKIYINGNLEATSSFTGNILINDEPFSIGRSSYDKDYYLGEMDEIRVYNRALSEDEIKEVLRGTVSGIVTDASSTGLDDATVTVGSESTTTQGGGFYSLQVPIGSYNLTVTKSGYETFTTSIIVSTAGVTVDCELHSTITDGTVNGRIRDSDGNGIGDATITASNQQTSSSSTSGFYSLSLPPGSYKLTVTKSGYNDAKMQITITSGSVQTVDFTLVSEEPPITDCVISGTVTDVDMKVVAGAIVTVAGGNTYNQTDALGQYSLTVSPGTYVLNVTKDGYESSSLTVTVNAGQTQTYDFQLTNASENGTLLGMPPIIPIIGGLGVIALATVVLLAKRKPKVQQPRPTQLQLHADPTELRADGRSTSTITLELTDKEGTRIGAVQNTMVYFKASHGSILSPITITPTQSINETTYRSINKPGSIRISAKAKGFTPATVEIELKEARWYCMHCGTQKPKDATQCPKCARTPPSGVDVRVCPNCHEVVPTIAHFCSTCGARLL